MRPFHPAVTLLLLAGCTSAPAARSSLPIPASGVIGVEEAQLTPDFWIRQASHPDQVLLSSEAIAAQNRVLFEQDRSVTDLERIPATIPGDTVRAWVTGLSSLPTRTVYDERGDTIAPARLAEIAALVQPEEVPATVAPRWALITRRADLRTFPTTLRVFTSRTDHDIDRWQETALFPGTPVVVVHGSRDGRWSFVVSPTYTAWVETRYVAEGTREQVLGYAHREPFLVVTGAQVRTVHTPEAPAVSEVQLDMSTRVPLLTDWPADRHVNGQHPYAGYVVQLPVRTDAGTLALVPALLPRTADVHAGWLPLTTRNLMDQAFKFLGERYGWGHSYNARDCSGFVGDVYRTFGVMLPRNTGDQQETPALRHTGFTQADTRDQRLAAVRSLQAGDLVFIPGHEMMVVGQYRGEPYIIHDTKGPSYLAPDGRIVSLDLNGVVVTPLTPLAGNPQTTWVDRMTAVQRIRP